MTHDMDVAEDLRLLVKEGIFRIFTGEVDDLELVMRQMILRAYRKGYERHARIYGVSNELLCRRTDNLNHCEGGPIGPDHTCKFPFVY